MAAIPVATFLVAVVAAVPFLAVALLAVGVLVAEPAASLVPVFATKRRG